MPVALPYDVRLRLLRVTHTRTDGRMDGQFGINMVGLAGVVACGQGGVRIVDFFSNIRA